MNVNGLIGLHCTWDAYDTLTHHEPADGTIVGAFFDQHLGACILAIPTKPSGDEYRRLNIVPIGYIRVNTWGQHKI